MSCILCANIGKKRKYFFKDEELCDIDYIGYLEFLLDDSDENVTSESAQSAFNSYKISLKPEPIQKQVEAEKKLIHSKPNPFKMGM